eukprot:NODE_477_length_6979_cov_0.820058.p4 type:complete len:159 gc:universal NODE_477_length_6979_cov_0.820058:780-304(-)
MEKFTLFNARIESLAKKNIISGVKAAQYRTRVKQYIRYCLNHSLRLEEENDTIKQTFDTFCSERNYHDEDTKIAIGLFYNTEFNLDPNPILLDCKLYKDKNELESKSESPDADMQETVDDPGTEIDMSLLDETIAFLKKSDSHADIILHQLEILAKEN